MKSSVFGGVFELVFELQEKSSMDTFFLFIIHSIRNSFPSDLECKEKLGDVQRKSCIQMTTVPVPSLH